MPRPWRQESLYLALCFAAATAVPFLPDAAQDRYAGYGFGAPPLLMIALATVAGTFALRQLRLDGFYAEPMAGLGLTRAAYWAGLFALAALVLDLVLPFRSDINVGWPEAWLFYPSIGIVAEAFLHLLPLAILFAALRRAGPAILLAAAVEPAFQALAGGAEGGVQLAAMAVLVFAIGLAELRLLRRHGIAAMVAFRLVYYLGWHVLWGGARLALGAAGS